MGTAPSISAAASCDSATVTSSVAAGSTASTGVDSAGAAGADAAACSASRTTACLPEIGSMISSITAMGALSPWRLPILVMRV